MTIVRLGTRGSQLALWQARAVAGLLAARGARVEIVSIKTTGDRLQLGPLEQAGDKGVFVREIEDALRSRDIDVAVHSAKDMSAVLPDGLAIAGVLPREDPRDAFVVRQGGDASSDATIEGVIAGLGNSPRIGTSSIRRSAQLARRVAGARFVPMRGNVDTRLRKLDAGEVDALVLAVAGMKRLGLESRISFAIPEHECLPAPGQGIVAVETRSEDEPIRAVIDSVSDPQTGACFDAERALVAALGGGCQLPLGAIAVHGGRSLELRAIVASADGSRTIRRDGRGPAERPAELGRRVADDLARAGATSILEEVRVWNSQ